MRGSCGTTKPKRIELSECKTLLVPIVEGRGGVIIYIYIYIVRYKLNFVTQVCKAITNIFARHAENLRRQPLTVRILPLNYYYTFEYVSDKPNTPV